MEASSGSITDDLRRIRCGANQQRVILEPGVRQRQVGLLGVAAVKLHAARITHDADDLVRRAVG